MAFLNKSFSVKTLYFYCYGYELRLKILLQFKNKTSKENAKIIFSLLSFSHQAFSENQFISLDEFIKKTLMKGHVSVHLENELIIC